MKLNLIPICFIAVIALAISCQRELTDIPGTPLPTPELPDTTTPIDPPAPVVTGNVIITNVHGRILDENGDPSPGATVTAGAKSAVTDEYGIFRLTNVSVKDDFTFVKVEKSGYLTGSRTILSEQNGNGFVVIKLLRKTVAATFDAASGAIVSVNNTTINLPANGIVTSSGSRYNGKVKVYTAVINPEAEDFSSIMPGDLRGITADSQFTAMKSYGMLTVDLETESGEPLQLATGQSATIKMKVPSSLLASAPASIPLWHFSETDGLWREEGSATLENGYYTGAVTHFSTWNFDVPSNFVFVTLRVRTAKGGVRPYSRVKIVDTRNGAFSDLYTDSAGYIKTWVPKDAPLNVQVLTDCGGILYTKDRPVVSEDTDLGTVYVGYGGTVVVYGKAEECDGAPLTGFANIFYAGLYYTTEIINGEYFFYLSKCDSENNSGDMYLTDAQNLHVVSKNVYFQVTTTNVDLGTTTTCMNEPVDWIEYKIVDSIRMESPPAAMHYTAFESGSRTTQIHFKQGMYDVGVHEITINIPDSSAGVYKTSAQPAVMLYNVWHYATDSTTIKVKSFGAIGEPIDVEFSGMFNTQENPTPVPMTGQLKVTRRK